MSGTIEETSSSSEKTSVGWGTWDEMDTDCQRETFHHQLYHNMPFSTPFFKPETLAFIKNKFRPSATVLDIGAGSGTYAKALGGYFEQMDAVEAFSPYIDSYNLKSLYTNVFNEDITKFQFDY